MTHLIRNYETGRFYSAGGWIADASQAECFTEIEAAVDLCRRLELSTVEVQIYLLTDGQDFRIPRAGFKVS
jgi:hypothetical protein